MELQVQNREEIAAMIIAWKKRLSTNGATGILTVFWIFQLRMWFILILSWKNGWTELTS